MENCFYCGGHGYNTGFGYEYHECVVCKGGRNKSPLGYCSNCIEGSVKRQQQIKCIGCNGTGKRLVALFPTFETLIYNSKL